MMHLKNFVNPIHGFSSLILFLMLVASCSSLAGDGEGVSLVFVFDTTGSMGEELAQVRTGAAKILDAALSNPYQVFKNFVLVPFNDPIAVGTVTVTSDSDVYKSALASITVNYGGDCPEYSLSGLKRGLELSEPRSYIYVFTDAAAKDYHMTNIILEEVQIKQSKIVFLTTGHCGNRYAIDFVCYDVIADASTGQVFIIDQYNVEEVLDSVIELTLPSHNSSDNNGASLLSLTEDEAGDAAYPLPVDSTLSDITASLSGENPNLEFYNADGEAAPEDQVDVILSLANVVIKRLNSPEPGSWIVNVSSNSGFSLRITGTSSFDFEPRFDIYQIVTKLNDFYAAIQRPVSGMEVYIFILVSGLEDGALIQKAEFINLKGEVLMTLALKASSIVSNLYYAGPFIVPEELFNIQISGVDEAGFPFQRGSKSAVSPMNSTDVNECEVESTGCHENAICVNTYESYKCDCIPGYSGNGTTCENTDECQQELDECDINASCMDTIGSYVCLCNSGYMGDGRTCSSKSSGSFDGLSLMKIHVLCLVLFTSISIF